MKIQASPTKKLASWPSQENFLLREQAYVTAQQGELQRLKDYVEQGRVGALSLLTNTFEWAKQPSRSSYFDGALRVVSRMRLNDAYAASHQVMQHRLGTAVLYRELASMLELLVEQEAEVRLGRKLRSFSIGAAAWVGLAAAIGDVPLMDRYASLLTHAVKTGVVRDDNVRGMLHFILRLWCLARGIEYPNVDCPRYEAAEKVLSIWSTSNASALKPLLLDLCNQHTHLTADGDFADFAAEFSHFPVEVLMLFRLRQQEGLENPIVDHPLMQFPWSSLWPESAAAPDELLGQIYGRLERDEGITVDQLYRRLVP